MSGSHLEPLEAQRRPARSWTVMLISGIFWGLGAGGQEETQGEINGLGAAGQAGRYAASGGNGPVVILKGR
jgi:hypothetical protein